MTACSRSAPQRPLLVKVQGPVASSPSRQPVVLVAGDKPATGPAGRSYRLLRVGVISLSLAATSSSKNLEPRQQKVGHKHEAQQVECAVDRHAEVDVLLPAHCINRRPHSE